MQIQPHGNCPAFRERHVITWHRQLLEPAATLELGQRTVVSLSIVVIAVDKVGFPARLAKLDCTRNESIGRSFIVMRVLRQDLANASRAFHVDKFDKSDHLLPQKSGEKFTSL